MDTIPNIVTVIIIFCSLLDVTISSPTTRPMMSESQSFSLLSPSMLTPRVESVKDGPSNGGDNDNQDMEAIKGSYSYSSTNLCEMFHSMSFIVESNLVENGCKIECLILTNSSEEKKEFFDKSIKFSHNLHDGLYCKRDHICSNGSCVLEFTAPIQNDVPSTQKVTDKLGIVVIELIDGRVPKKDHITASDTFVRIDIKTSNDVHDDNGHDDDGHDNESEKSIKIETSKVVWDTNHPSFNATFKFEKVPLSATINFDIYDRDMVDANDFIGNVSIKIMRILERNLNHREITFPIFKSTDKYYLRVKISWIAYE